MRRERDARRRVHVPRLEHHIVRGGPHERTEAKEFTRRRARGAFFPVRSAPSLRVVTATIRGSRGGDGSFARGAQFAPLSRALFRIHRRLEFHQRTVRERGPRDAPIDGGYGGHGGALGGHRRGAAPLTRDVRVPRRDAAPVRPGPQQRRPFLRGDRGDVPEAHAHARVLALGRGPAFHSLRARQRGDVPVRLEEKVVRRQRRRTIARPPQFGSVHSGGAHDPDVSAHDPVTRSASQHAPRTVRSRAEFFHVPGSTLGRRRGVARRRRAPRAQPADGAGEIPQLRLERLQVLTKLVELTLRGAVP